MQTTEFKYDLALSFVAKDEALAVQLADQFEGRLSVFVYSRHQEQLAGTDGEKTFNDVFAKQARLVVVLYRAGWGQTPWTRIEETAIRNRAFEGGFDFVVFIPLDEQPSVPNWLPRSRLWIGLSRWGIQGAASVIDARFQELGGEPKVETLEDRAARIERDLGYEKRRSHYLGSDEGVRGARHSFESLRDTVLAAVPRLQASAPSLRISAKHQDRQVVLLSDGPALSISLRLPHSNTLENSVLEAIIWRGHPPFPGVRFYDEPRSLAKHSLTPDFDGKSGHTWTVVENSGTRQMDAGDAAEYILRWWLETAPKHRGDE